MFSHPHTYHLTEQTCFASHLMYIKHVDRLSCAEGIIDVGGPLIHFNTYSRLAAICANPIRKGVIRPRLRSVEYISKPGGCTQRERYAVVFVRRTDPSGAGVCSVRDV
jgi:hypothetical protein